MKKSELTQLLAQYQPEKSTFLGVLLSTKDSKEIVALKAILISDEVAKLSDDDKLPGNVLDKAKQVLSDAKNTDENTKRFLDQLKTQLYPAKPDWQQSEAPIIEVCGSAQLTNFFTVTRQASKNSASEINLPINYLPLIAIRNIFSYLLPRGEVNNLKLVSKQFYYAVFNDANVPARRLINAVTWGKQKIVEDMLKENPVLATQKVRVIDRNERQMYCTAYQRARWEGDWYMYQMMEQFMSGEEIEKQRKELDDRGLGESGKYGSRFDFTDLFTAYKSFIKRSDEIWAPNRTQTNAEYAELDRLWERVYQEQAKLPAHVIHQFMHPKRSFLIDGKPPEFNEPTLERNTKFGDNSSVFSKSGKYVLGSNFGLVRYNWGWPRRPAAQARAVGAGEDFAALSRLEDVITINHQQTCKKAPQYAIESRAASSTSGLM